MQAHRHIARFLFGFSHAEHPLTGVQRAKYDARVTAMARGDRRSFLIALAPGWAAVAMIPVWISLQKRTTVPWQLAAQVIFALLVAAWAVWMIRWKHRRYGPRALRELGFADICPRCAYDLIHHVEPEGRCPECGESFTRFHPDETWSTDQQ